MADVFIHPTSRDLVETVQIGAGTKIWSHVVILKGAVIGRDCIIGKGAFIDAGVVVGDRVKIQNGVNLYRGVVVEDGVFFGPGATTTNDLDPAAITPQGRLKTGADWQLGRTLFRAGARVGANATVLCAEPPLIVGRWALIAAHALVTSDVADFALVAGVPARFIRYVCPAGLRHLVQDGVEGPLCTVCDRTLQEVVEP